MIKTSILLILTLSMVSCASWGILVASPKFWYNYPFQSNVYHAYQILKRRGVPTSNIIVMAYDDIANFYNNPFKGQVFNKPDGENVYSRILIDYKGAEVNPKNFKKVITGDSEGISARVLESNENDNVFIYFSGVYADSLRFPELSQYILPQDFVEMIKTMYKKKLYKNLLVYLDAGSFSQFKSYCSELRKVHALLAVTNTSDFAYCNATVKKTLVGACLGTKFGVTWMEKTDKTKDLSQLKVEKQVSYTNFCGYSEIQRMAASEFMGSNLLLEEEEKENNNLGFLEEPIY